ncbi:inositol-pentakisphosphate 2-kinase [Rhodotorula paludigena]|uniref:inositol-pentakisphosphate 2-kinase n=1 Tax=Rhodotorula paludigena TaxID=86838 RepID=UPI00317E5D8E
MPLSSLPPPSSWRYTAEGGANLVLSFAGSSTSPYAGHALRLRKRKVAEARGDAAEAVHGEVETSFGRDIVAPLLGQEHLVEMREIALERTWLEELATCMRAVRPPERQAVDEVDLDARVGVLVEDLIAGDGVLAIEIKPKWGFLPNPAYLSATTAPTKTSHCRTCMHRFYKRASGAAEQEDGFCPLGLYSGDEGRVRRAVGTLFSSWESSGGTINNLRFFYERKRVSPDELQSAVHPLKHALAACDSSFDGTRALLTDLLVSALFASPVLRTLATLQATLDAFDIEGLVSLIQACDTAMRSSPANDLERNLASFAGAQPSLSDWRAFLARHLPLLSRTAQCTSLAERHALRDGMAASLRRASEEAGSARDAVLAYLLSATLKDCSLIVRIPLGAREPGPEQGDAGEGVQVQIKAIDLDPKPIRRLGKYWRMDGNIVECWRERLERMTDAERTEVRRCVE